MLRGRIAQRIPNAVFSDDPNASDNPVLADIPRAQRFLHSEGLPFPCGRVVFDGFSLANPRIGIATSSLMLTWYCKIHIMQVSLSFLFERVDTDTAIFLHYLADNDEPFAFADGTSGPISTVLPHHLMGKLGITYHDSPAEMNSTYLLELNDVYCITDPDALLTAHANQLYGMLTGDEG